MKLEGIKIQNYRSFDEEGIELNDLGNVNIIVGKNNSGKSNILTLIGNLYKFLSNEPLAIDVLKINDHYKFNRKTLASFTLKIGKEFFYIEDGLLDYFKNTSSMAVEYIYSIEEKRFVNSSSHLKEIILPEKANDINFKLNYGILNDSYEQLIQAINRYVYINDTKVCLINSFRKIEPAINVDKSNLDYMIKAFSGFDLIKRLDDFKNPRSANQMQRIKFNKIENFVKEILNEKNLSIEISSDDNLDKELSLRINDLQVPLENLGTGVHQLIIIAATITILENCVICIEEPETFVHPEIQRKFINYLLTTKNQYFISTHSNVFLNIEGIDVYHVSHDGQKSIVNKVLASTEKNELLDDLGYQASDLLQANYLLWVEGPTDRIYINHWMRTLDKNLIEGIHYSIMFYGGKLLAHLSADENALNDFIKLKLINRNTGIVIDSDKENNADTINKTKQRILNEFGNNGYFTWVTQGKEIENYISEHDLRSVISSFTNKENITIKYGPYKPLNKYYYKNEEHQIDKVSLSLALSKINPSLETMDLKEKIQELVNKIKTANNF
jgi:AAA15 family ATPase/GTPase